MKKGILYALSIYTIGFGLAWIVYYIYGHPYIHAPGFHHLIVFLTILIGLFTTIAAIIFFFIKKKSIKIKAFIFTNSLIISGCVIYLYLAIKNENRTELVNNTSKKEMTMRMKRDTIIVYHNQKIVYLKIKDSIHFNQMKNIKNSD